MLHTREKYEALQDEYQDYLGDLTSDFASDIAFTFEEWLMEELVETRKKVQTAKGHFETIRDYGQNPDAPSVNAGDMSDAERLSGATGQALAALDTLQN